MSTLNFKLFSTDKSSKARTGLLHTPHGDIETPVFMPVGTAGAVKAVHMRELKGRHTCTDNSWQYISSVSPSWCGYN